MGLWEGLDGNDAGSRGCVTELRCAIIPDRGHAALAYTTLWQFPSPRQRPAVAALHRSPGRVGHIVRIPTWLLCC